MVYVYSFWQWMIRFSTENTFFVSRWRRTHTNQLIARGLRIDDIRRWALSSGWLCHNASTSSVAVIGMVSNMCFHSYTFFWRYWLVVVFENKFTNVSKANQTKTTNMRSFLVCQRICTKYFISDTCLLTSKRGKKHTLQNTSTCSSPLSTKSAAIKAEDRKEIRFFMG